ncbi:hypothetical protein [Pseudochrobactrum sp. B5]|uniref:hypothetical protein n=1 Tax=Pseudochrobactrum sp. B5 TaxID=1289478 RepID=UPI0009521D83|nr:hypothetical protein [Pseudochrobactrum sp. B5]
MSEIRQFEELGFHAWPALQVTHFGDWAVQLTPYYPSKRGNSVNLLNPADDADLAQRVEACEALFTAQGKQPVFRLTPLAPPALADYLVKRGYTATGASSVMACDLRDNAALKTPQPRLPLRLVQFRDGQEIGYSRISGVFHDRLSRWWRDWRKFCVQSSCRNMSLPVLPELNLRQHCFV